ncbi:uncharacterized protein FOMMEDRAFT_144177, partial [Fomitiporia mediterranea MF3/22]|uniref:uncharacterized protein n=1 Tax=Fomitiporia mediterranea (strain MF3/22) TaxID=694068 RepID=UPI0004409149
MTVSSGLSTVSLPDFNLDNFPPPRPSTPAARAATTPLKHAEFFHSPLSSEYKPTSPMPPPYKQYGLPSNPRSLRSLESGVRRYAPPRPRSGIRGAISGIFSHKPEPDLDIPIQDVSSDSSHTRGDSARTNAWSPLRIEKREIVHTESCRCQNPKRKKQHRLCIVLLVILLLYLFVNAVVVNIRVFAGKKRDTNILSPEQQLCLTQFTVNAPANASLYPCSTCLNFLQGIPSSFRFAAPDDAQTLSNSLQFCGLQSLFTASGAAAQGALANGGWVQDVNFWKVKSLQMVFPAVPSVMPSGIGALTSLQSLQITGGNGIPAGAFPGSFANLTSLTSLDLESTSLTAPPATLFQQGAVSGLTSLTLVKNTGFAGAFPDVSALALQSLVVSDQQISTPLSSLLNSSTITNSLTTLSLTSTNLTGSFPSSSSSSSQQGQDLPNLQTLSLSSNPSLSGSMPESVCASTKLVSC